MTDDRTPPAVSEEARRQSERKANLEKFDLAFAIISETVAATRTNASGLIFDAKPGVTQWELTARTGILDAYAPDTKTVSTRLVTTNTSHPQVKESITAHETTSHLDKKTLFGVHQKPLDPDRNKRQTWSETEDTEALMKLIDIYIPPITGTTTLGTDNDSFFGDGLGIADTGTFEDIFPQSIEVTPEA